MSGKLFYIIEKASELSYDTKMLLEDAQGLPRRSRILIQFENIKRCVKNSNVSGIPGELRNYNWRSIWKNKQ